MNENVQYQSTPSTAATITILGFSAALAVGSATYPGPETPAFFTIHSMPSYSAFEKSLTFSIHSTARDFGQEIATVYAALSEKQEPLGEGFEAVWDQNVESLYES